MLKQMSDRGENIKSQGGLSSRSSSGEGPDEITAVDDASQDPASPSYVTNQRQQQTASSILTSSVELESSESRKLVDEANDLKSRLKELNIGSFDDSGGQDG